MDNFFLFCTELIGSDPRRSGVLDRKPSYLLIINPGDVVDTVSGTIVSWEMTAGTAKSIALGIFRPTINDTIFV